MLPIRFASKWLASETGLYDYNHRVYAPHEGRFISRDPIGENGGLNLYTYCGNDSIGRWDLLGMKSGEFPVDMDGTPAGRMGRYVGPEVEYLTMSKWELLDIHWAIQEEIRRKEAEIEETMGRIRSGYSTGDQKPQEPPEDDEEVVVLDDFKVVTTPFVTDPNLLLALRLAPGNVLVLRRQPGLRSNISGAFGSCVIHKNSVEKILLEKTIDKRAGDYIVTVADVYAPAGLQQGLSPHASSIDSQAYGWAHEIWQPDLFDSAQCLEIRKMFNIAAVLRAPIFVVSAHPRADMNTLGVVFIPFRTEPLLHNWSNGTTTPFPSPRR